MMHSQASLATAQSRPVLSLIFPADRSQFHSRMKLHIKSIKLTVNSTIQEVQKQTHLIMKRTNTALQMAQNNQESAQKTNLLMVK